MRKNTYSDPKNARGDAPQIEAGLRRDQLPNRLMTAFEVAAFVGCHSETHKRRTAMVAAHPRGLNRKQRKELARRLRVEDPGLEVMHPHAAGIDVGNSVHYVAVRPDRDPDSVRRFDCFTADWHRLADWLQHCGVTTVAMQSTGVYWIPVYEILDARGFEVYLVNARHTKNLPGRKSDVQESQWLLKLHTYGLLRNAFHPSAEIRVVRTYWRQRGDHVHAVSTCIQRMQKVLTQMNIQLANVISDLSGWTGQRIVRAILAGERDPETLAALSHPGIHATRQTIARSLEGTWQPDLVFVLHQEVAMYDTYLQRIAECDAELERHLKTVADKGADTAPAGKPSPMTPPERRAGARVPSGGEKRAAMPRSLTWAVNCSVSAAST
jgi:transposase